jgi:hypothetical protein
MVQMVNYFKMESERNPGIAVVFGTWPERVMKHRGWTSSRHITRRVATEAEHDWLSGCLRYQAYLYPNTASLLEDESKILEPDVLARLAYSLHLHEITNF